MKLFFNSIFPILVEDPSALSGYLVMEDRSQESLLDLCSAKEYFAPFFFYAISILVTGFTDGT